jgi:acyl-CoA thioester hydrolase
MTHAKRSSVDIEVRYAETDQMGVVHHAAYLVWFEVARTHLCMEAGIHYAEIEQQGHFLMMKRAEADYRKGATYGDTVTVTAWIDRLASRTLRFGYEVHRDHEGQDRLLARGFTEHVWVDRAKSRPCRLPAKLEPAFRQLAGALKTES